MYKKITHNIVEEHFDHPIASQIKKSMEKKTITNEVFSETKFRSDVNAYFEKYRNSLNSLITSSAGTDDEFLSAFDNMFRTAWIDDLGNLSKAIYLTEFGERLNENMRILATSLFLVLQSLKVGKEPVVLSGRMQFFANDLAGNLNAFNPAWTFNIVNPLLNGIIIDLLNQAKAKTAKNLALEQQLAQKVATGFDTLAKTLIDGMISQNPERFNRAAIPRSFNDRNVM